MGNSHSVQKINFEYMQEEINSNNSYIISTLPIEKQDCLIQGTLNPDREVELLNSNLKSNTSIRLVVYAMNACDESLAIKCHQLLKLGFTNLMYTVVYLNGYFWDIYGEELFPTTIL